MRKSVTPTPEELNQKLIELGEKARAELRRRGMTDAEIDAAIKKGKRNA